MLTKINREDCLQEFPNFPLRHYDEVSDEEEYYYPEVFATQWLQVTADDKNERTQLLASQLTKLMKELGYSELIFLGDTEQTWISKLSLGRNDYEPLNEALQYLTSNNVDKDFNGGLKIIDTHLNKFFEHFYCLTSCDASLPYFHFMDTDENFIGYIHYNGEVRIDTLNKRTQQRLENVINESRFTEVPQKTK